MEAMVSTVNNENWELLTQALCGWLSLLRCTFYSSHGNKKVLGALHGVETFIRHALASRFSPPQIDLSGCWCSFN